MIKKTHKKTSPKHPHSADLGKKNGRWEKHDYHKKYTPLEKSKCGILLTNKRCLLMGYPFDLYKIPIIKTLTFLHTYLTHLQLLTITGSIFLNVA